LRNGRGFWNVDGRGMERGDGGYARCPLVSIFPVDFGLRVFILFWFYILICSWLRLAFPFPLSLYCEIYIYIYPLRSGSRFILALIHDTRATVHAPHTFLYIDIVQYIPCTYIGIPEFYTIYILGFSGVIMLGIIQLLVLILSLSDACQAAGTKRCIL